MNIFQKTIIILLILILLILLLLYIIEYKPKNIENINVVKNQNKEINLNKTISLLTYNIGFASLDKNQDFFLDGGKGYGNLDKTEQLSNLNGISSILKENPCDIYLLQEVDLNCTRTHNINQIDYIRNSLTNYSSSFALFHKVLWIPYPFKNMMGKVNSGITTLNSYKSESSRIKLDSAYKFPVSGFMFKRPLLKTIIPIKNSVKSLVVFNLHLEAYDTNGTREKQLTTLLNNMQTEYDKGNYVIAGGDFNQYFPNNDGTKYPVINKEYFVAGQIKKDFFSENFTFENDNTYPTSRLLNISYDEKNKDNQFYVIDGFIVSDNIETIFTKVIDTKFEYSDHNPVTIEIKLKK